MTAWQQTYTGRAFTPLDPRIEDIDLLDIARALSRQCRFAGHITGVEFYSVAEHSVYVSRCVPERLASLALLHDAAEAYIVDVPRPIKAHLHGYREIEDRILDRVMARFDVAHCPLFWQHVKHADDSVLAAERDQIMGPPPRPWAPLPEPPPGLVIAGLMPDAAMALFLERARELGLV